MKKIVNLLILFLLIIQSHKSVGQDCLLDSIGNKKIVYNEFNRPKLIQYQDDFYDHGGKVTVYQQINYNANNLASITSFVINLAGDTIRKPSIYRRFEFKNNKLSKITDYDTNYGDIVWDDDKIIAYKSYSWSDSADDSLQTRILTHTYINDNIDNFVCKELSGYLVSDQFFSYDSYKNPYYKSDLAIIEGNLTDYSCKNNWIKTEGTGNYDGKVNRVISYNKYDYPVKIVSDFGDGRISFQTFSYSIINSVANDLPYAKISVYPNPVHDYINIENKTSERIYKVNIIDLQGRVIRQFSNSDQMSVDGIDNGVYFVKIMTKNQAITNKVVIKAN